MPKTRSFCVGVLVTALGLAAAGTTANAAVTEVEGSAGGGIVPWALLSGGKPTASFTWVNTGDYNHTTLAVQGTLMDRLELSYARLALDVGGHHASELIRAIGHTDGTVDLDVFGAKLKLLDMGDGVPAVAVGVQYKRTHLDDAVLTAIGADEDSGTDVYLAATKVFPIGERKLLLNGTLRATKANQLGYLGFGGKGAGNDDGYSAQFEGSVGMFLNKDTMLGAEYRTKPDNLGGFKEQDWWDIFVAYMPNKNWSVTAAYANLGDIITEASDLGAGSDVPEGESQRGLYLQVQANF